MLLCVVVQGGEGPCVVVGGTTTTTTTTVYYYAAGVGAADVNKQTFVKPETIILSKGHTRRHITDKEGN